MLNDKGQRIKPRGTPKTISSHLLYDEFNFVLCFRLDM